MYDRPIDQACSRKRPDFIFEAPLGFTVIVEVDEYQHNGYYGKQGVDKTDCEVVRMRQIFQDNGGAPLVFIRYNPDTFRTNDKIVRVPDQARHDALLRLLRQLLTRTELPPGDHGRPAALVAYYLFYDGQGSTWDPTRIVIDEYAQ